MTEQPGTRALAPALSCARRSRFRRPVTASTARIPIRVQVSGGARSARRTQPQLVPPEPDWKTMGAGERQSEVLRVRVPACGDCTVLPAPKPTPE